MSDLFFSLVSISLIDRTLTVSFDSSMVVSSLLFITSFFPICFLRLLKVPNQSHSWFLERVQVFNRTRTYFSFSSLQFHPYSFIFPVIQIIFIPKMYHTLYLWEWVVSCGQFVDSLIFNFRAAHTWISGSPELFFVDLSFLFHSILYADH